MMLSDYVELNPRVALARDAQVPFVSMDVVAPGTRWVYPAQQRPATGSGSRFAPGDTLFARITPCLENGKIAQYAGDRPGMGSTEFFVLRARVGISDPGYVYYFSQSQDLRSAAEKSMSGASGRQRAAISSLSDFECEFPPLPIQRRIAGILSAYDELIENSQRRIRILESMARALYREWFVHFRFPSHESVPRVPSPLGEIPQGWAVKKLGEIAEELRRNVRKGELQEPKPFVGLEHIPRRSLALDAWEIATELGSNKLSFNKGDVLFGKIRPYFHKVCVAPFDGLCSADTIVIRSKRPALYSIVVACVSSDAFVAEASATANGAKMPRANWSVLKEFPVLVPTDEVLVQFGGLFSRVVEQQQLLVFQIQNLRRTRQLLLPRLMSGQLDVEAMG